jgi:hypothetical protein
LPSSRLSVRLAPLLRHSFDPVETRGMCKKVRERVVLIAHRCLCLAADEFAKLSLPMKGRMIWDFENKSVLAFTPDLILDSTAKVDSIVADTIISPFVYIFSSPFPVGPQPKLPTLRPPSPNPHQLHLPPSPLLHHPLSRPVPSEHHRPLRPQSRQDRLEAAHRLPNRLWLQGWLGRPFRGSE